MKKVIPSLVALLGISIAMFCPPGIACDETCLRDKAQIKYNVVFPSYLTERFCEDIAMDFMRTAVRSLDKYRNDHFSTKYKGPLKNTRQFLVQRREWLKECDDYLNKTKQSYVFANKKTTEQIFSSIDRVRQEFTALIDGASYASDSEAKAVMDEKIDALFQVVDDHRTRMHLKGRYVIR